MNAQPQNRLGRWRSIFVLLAVVVAGCALSTTTLTGPTQSATAAQGKSHGTLKFDVKYPVGKNGKYPVTAKFVPAHKGAVVKFQRQVGGKWKTVVTAKEGAKGVAKANIGPKKAKKVTGWRAVATKKGPKITTKVIRPKLAVSKSAFTDEFNKSALDLSKWAYRSVGVRSPGATDKYGRDQGRLCSVPSDSPRVVSVVNGKLQLSVYNDDAPGFYDPTKCPNGYFLNSQIQTKQSFTRGVFSARIKFHSQCGAHGALWLQGSNLGAEMDAVEYYGDCRPKNELITQYVHPNRAVCYTKTGAAVTCEKSGGFPKKAQKLFTAKKRPSNGWHVYSVQWTKKAYIFRIDGVQTFKTSKPYMSNVPEAPILSLLTSGWEVNGHPETLAALRTGKVKMQVDWVRIWK